MNRHVLLILCLVVSLVAGMALLAAPLSTFTIVSAQGPSVGVDQESQSSVSRAPESLGEGEPDARLPNAPASCGASPMNCLYYHLPGTSFLPRESGYTFHYDGMGCFHATGDSPAGFMAPILLEPGSIIKYLRVYYRDTNASNMGVDLQYFDDGLNAPIISTVYTSGSATGVRSTLSVEITHTVDYYNYSYGVMTFDEPGFYDGSIQICGLRIAYVLPTNYGLGLPLITR